MLHAKWHEIKRKSSPPTSRLDLQALWGSFLDLDGDFQAWETTIPSVWKFKMEPNTPENQSAFDERWVKLFLANRGAPDEIHSYSSLKRSWIWGFYRTSRIFLLRDMLEVLNWMFRLPEPDWALLSTHLPEKPSGPSAIPFNSTSGELDNITLRNHHSLTTISIVDMIEKSCSAILCNFTIPIPNKSFDDVVGTRGYVCLWTLGTMDAVLASGLIPDSKVSATALSSSDTQVSLIPRPTDRSPQDPATNITSLQNIQLGSQKPFATAVSLPQSSTLRSPEDRASASTTSALKPSPLALADSNWTTPTGHIFDDGPSHPYDSPVKPPSLDIDIVEPKKLDIAARREWLNCILYYIGTELGVKKALCIPYTAGFMKTVKPKVDSIFGRK